MKIDNIWTRTVLVDFDGCVVEAKFPEVGEIKSGAINALAKLRELGFYVVIWSSRMSRVFEGHPDHLKFQEDMLKCLTGNNVPYDEVDDGTNGKRPGIAYIDDAGLDLDDGWGGVVAKFTARQEARKSER